MTIRRQPEDFAVTERPMPAFLAALSPSRSGEAPHAVYELTKRSLATPEATGMFGRAVGVGGGRVDYAGLKDKHARTVQMVSVEPGDGRVPRQVDDRGWSARLLGWSGMPVTAECIEGNRFEIVVRDLSKAACNEMDHRAGLLRSGGSLLVMNYFGAQRFGSARHGQGFIGPRLIKGEFEGALRLAIGTPARKDTGKTRAFTRACARHWGEWQRLATELPRCPERRAIETLAAGGSFAQAFAALPHFTQQMAVEAYQSHIWNATARRLAQRIVGDAAVGELAKMPEGPGRVRPLAALRANDDFGPMLFPPAVAVGEAWPHAHMPVLGPRTELVAPWGVEAAAVLEEEGIRQEDLGIPGFRRPYFGEANRALFVIAEGFEMTPPEQDEMGSPKAHKRTLRFALGRGAYATVVLRALGQ